jgi:hypothetical protein
MSRIILCKISLFLLLALGHTLRLAAQDSVSASRQQIQPAVMTYPQISEGIPVRSVVLLLHKQEQIMLADSAEKKAFEDAFGIRPGAAFRQYIADLAIRTIEAQPDIRNARYELYNTELSGPVVMVVHVYFLDPGEQKSVAGKKGMFHTKSSKSFPVLHESDRSKLMFVLNGGIGLFNEINPFFSQGQAFTKGNIVATNPAGKGVRFWGEAYLEPGLAAIAQLGKSKFFAYGSASLLVSGRNTSDIYSDGATVYAAMERLYAGVLGAGLGKNKNINLDLAYGRQFFQLNDGFLLSKFSGSANAGERGSVYLNSRTAFQKAATAKFQYKNWMVQGFWLEPQELFKEFQNNPQFSGGGVTYNDNKHIDAGLYYIGITGGKVNYRSINGNLPQKGMYIINPKLWIKDIAQTGLFFKGEYAWQSHYTEDMRAQAWYAGLGISKNKWKYRPSLYYRYASMSGDDSLTQRYERFDPILTGGLGNWVQGINLRKILGNGNLLSHRVELKAYFSKSFEVSLDYFYLQSQTLENTGGLSPIAKLKDRALGQELTLTTRYFLSDHFLLLGVLSYAKPGQGMRLAFDESLYDWTSIQCALFMFF